MPERINKDAFIANILECFTLLQTYEECYKEILDIIDVVNGLNENDLTIANLKNLIEGSEYISFDNNEAGTKLVISLDRAHLDNVPTANSTHLVTSGGVQKSIANTQSSLENTINAKTQGMLKLPINIPTEPLVVMVDTNNAQTNVPLGDGLAYQNGHLVATGGGGGGGISPSDDNTFTGKQTFSGGIVSTKPATADNELITLAQMKNSNLGNQNYTDTKVANKLDKATSTSGSYAYVRNGTKDETIPVNPLVGNNAIVRRTSTGTIKANAGVDENDCVNKKQLDDAIAGVGGDVTKAYVDAQDTKLQQSINATDTQVQALNEEVATIKTDTIPAINNTLNNKLDKMTSTGSGVKVYAHEDGVNKLLNATSDKTRNLIVRWDNMAQLHANAGTTDDAVVNKKQMEDAIAGVSGGAQLNVANTWTALQTFNAGLTTSFGDGGLQFTTTNVPLGTYTLFKVTYKYSSRDWTDTYKVTTTKHGYTKTLITNEDIKTSDFTWNSTDNKLELNTRIVSCDQAFYDGLTNKDKNTLYVIVG